MRKLLKVSAFMAAMVLGFGLLGCSSGDDDSDNVPSDNGKTTVEVKSTGTISAASEEGGYLVSRCTDSDSGEYEFKQASARSAAEGEWKYTKDSKVLYEGTFEGDLSEMKDGSALKLELTVTKADGKLVKEKKKFDFNVSAEGKFTAEIPVLEPSLLPAPVGENPFAGSRYSHVYNDGPVFFTFTENEFSEGNDESLELKYKYSFDTTKKEIYTVLTSCRLGSKTYNSKEDVAKDAESLAGMMGVSASEFTDFNGQAYKGMFTFDYLQTRSYTLSDDGNNLTIYRPMKDKNVECTKVNN
ncbi:hypothetical protein [Treponema sp.]|uniref:hypothetical protein n=1 Tax=Treponema sp. TaxID=166 RepID=UPI00298E9AF5|nr:hypothetical protein [Treponema sp.]MCQ2242373.1 hypothetical protein [Treponema sp.]